MDRRTLLVRSAALLVGAPCIVRAGASDFGTRPRELWLHHKVTGEEGRVLFWERGVLVRDGFEALCWMLRDHHTGQAAVMDPGLLNLAYGIQGWLADWGVAKPLVVTRGFSTTATNAKVEGAAQNSMHPRGRALDFYVEGLAPEILWKMAVYYRRGGVGFYPLRGHTHIDTGEVRYWAG